MTVLKRTFANLTSARAVCQLLAVAVLGIGLTACTVETNQDAGDPGGDAATDTQADDTTAEDTESEDTESEDTETRDTAEDTGEPEDTHADAGDVDTGGMDGTEMDVSEERKLVSINPLGTSKATPQNCGKDPKIFTAGNYFGQHWPNGYIGNVISPESYPFKVKKVEYLLGFEDRGAHRCANHVAHEVLLTVVGKDQDKPVSKPSENARVHKVVNMPAMPPTATANGRTIRTMTPVEFGDITLREGEKLFVAIQYKKYEEPNDGGGMDAGTSDAGASDGGNSSDAGDAGMEGPDFKTLCPAICGSPGAGFDWSPAHEIQDMTYFVQGPGEPYMWLDYVKQGFRGNPPMEIWGSVPK